MKDGAGQSITVIAGRYSWKALKVLFDTNVYGQGTREFRNLYKYQALCIRGIKTRSREGRYAVLYLKAVSHT